VRRHDDPLVPFDRNDLPARRPGRIRQRVRHRTRSRAARLFSDAVFAIAVTLLVLEIHPPEDTRHLFHGLAALWPSYLSYAVTFLLIGQVWANHHVMFDHIRSADRTVLFLNTVLLMDIAFLPFAAAVLSAAFRTGHGQRTAVVFYGIVFEVAAMLFNVIWGHARHDQRLLATTIDFGGGQSQQPALPARPGLDRRRHPAGRPAPRPRHGRDRRVHPPLLAADPWRDRLAADPWRDRQRQAQAPRPR
jgi:uncharacterized membrane protein